MKKLIILILLVFHAIAINAQERSVRVNVVKMDHVTTAERDLYVVPNNQTWKIYNTTTSQKEINVGGSGWVADTGSGGGTTYTASNGIQIVGSTDIQLSTAFKNTLDLITVTQAVDLDDVFLKDGSVDATGSFNLNSSNILNVQRQTFINTGVPDINFLFSSESSTRFFNIQAGTGASTTALEYNITDDVWGFKQLIGTGDRMVVANADGELSTQAIPSGGGTDDQTATEVPFTPNGSIAATNVQAAIQEVRDEYPSQLTVNTNPIATNRGHLISYYGGQLIENSEIEINNAGNLLRMDKVSMTGNHIIYNSLDGTKQWLVGNRKGYADSAKDSTSISIFPLDDFSQQSFTFDYEDTRWEIHGSPIITAANAASNGIGTGAVSSVNSQTGAVVLDTDDISDTAANNKYVDAAEKAKIANAIEGVISGRTGTQVTNILSQTAAQLASDGAANTGEIIFCSDCAPMALQTASTFDLDDFRGIDDRVNDTATFTFSNVKTGSSVLIEANRATDATYSGITIAHTKGSFSANTRQLITIFILPSGEALFDYKDLE